MGTMKKITIILPVRNGGELVKECVQSILSQTYSDFDFIILDNHSDDGTYEWISSNTDNRIKIFRSAETLSMPQNWARILDAPKNEWITVIGHDDILYPGYLQVMHDLIQLNPDASLYQTHFDYININGNKVRSCLPMPAKMDDAGFLKAEFLQTMDSMGTGYMMRSKDFDMLRGFSASYPNLIFADYQLWVQLTGKSYLAISPQTGFGYRLHQSLSITTAAENYRLAFGKYIHFLKDYMVNKPKVKQMVEEYGYVFLMYFCQSLSHRLLKSPPANRLSVKEFINECKQYAQMLGIPQPFEPAKKLKIWAALQLDKSNWSRNLFRLIRKK